MYRSVAYALGSSLVLGGVAYFVYRRGVGGRVGRGSCGGAGSATTGSATTTSGMASGGRPANAGAKKVLVLGLKGSGKTTLLRRLTGGCGDATAPPTPTDGFNVAQCELAAPSGCSSSSSSSTQRRFLVNFWEIGGGEDFRKFWSNFYSSTDCLLFLIDAADRRLLGEAAEELARAAGDYRIGGAPIVVVASKQDIPASRIDALTLRRLLTDCGVAPDVVRRIRTVAAPPEAIVGSGGDAGECGIEALKDLLATVLEIRVPTLP